MADSAIYGNGETPGAATAARVVSASQSASLVAVIIDSICRNRPVLSRGRTDHCSDASDPEMITVLHCALGTSWSLLAPARGAADLRELTYIVVLIIDNRFLYGYGFSRLQEGRISVDGR